MASVKFRLRESRVNRKGESPIMIQVFSCGTKKEISSGIKIQKDLWDKNKNEVKRKHPRRGPLNAILREREAEIYTIIDELQKTKPKFSANEVITLYRKQIDEIAEDKTIIVNYLKDFVERNPLNYKTSTFLTYRIFINCFATFKKDVTFNDITLELVNSYEKYLRDKGLAINTISNRMKILRRAITLAIEDGIISNNPMLGYKRKREEGQRSFLTVEEFKLLEGFEAKTDRQQKVVDLFCFLVYSGLRIGDLLTAKVSDFTEHGDRLYVSLKMNKTGKRIKHKLTYKAQAIFNQYADFDKKYIFGVLNEKHDLKNPIILDKEVNRKTSYFNKILKATGKTLGIDKIITTHVGRHTFATVSLSLGAPIEVISKILGHRNIKETQIYAKILDESKEKVIDQWDAL